MARKLKQGCVQIFTGNGKGKSTAAFGTALRAAGHGYHTVIVQFMKTGDGYGETKSFQRLAPEVELYSYGSDSWVSKGNGSDEDIRLARAALAKAEEALADESVDILILDEINNAVWFELLDVDDVLALLAKRPAEMEIIMTGRNAAPELIDAADLVSEVCEIKHPYQKGIDAREGIEY